MTRWTERRVRYREILQGKRCVHPGSVFDPMSIRIAESVGYELGMFAGSTASLTVLGAPDIIVLTLSEFADQALRINRAGRIPLMVDADHGYGNAMNVMRTVEELEIAGIAGMSIEDTVLPLAFGAVGQPSGKPGLISVEEGVGKMRAALQARTDKSLIIAGRTSAPQLTTVTDAIARGKAYAATGVDAMFYVGVKTRADLDAIAAEIKIPLILGGSSPDLLDRDYLAGRGVRVALQGHQPIQAAVRAIHATMQALRDGTPPAKLEGLASAELMKIATRAEDYERWTKDFLS